MGREHQLDSQRAHGFEQRVWRDTLCNQPGEAVLTRPALRRRVRIDSILAPAPGTMMLFGDVGEMQEMRERARYWKRLVDRHPAELIGQHAEVDLISRSSALGERTNALDPLEQCPTGVRL